MSYKNPANHYIRYSHGAFRYLFYIYSYFVSEKLISGRVENNKEILGNRWLDAIKGVLLFIQHKNLPTVRTLGFVFYIEVYFGMPCRVSSRILIVRVFGACAFNLGLFNVHDINFHTFLHNPSLCWDKRERCRLSYITSLPPNLRRDKACLHAFRHIHGGWSRCSSFSQANQSGNRFIINLHFMLFP